MIFPLTRGWSLRKCVQCICGRRWLGVKMLGDWCLLRSAHRFGVGVGLEAEVGTAAPRGALARALLRRKWRHSQMN